MKRYPILLIAWLAPSMAQAGLMETLQSALGEYAVPPSEEYCLGKSLGDYGAEYDTAKGKAKCRCADMYYDAGLRHCEMCPFGTKGDFHATTCGDTSCSAGYRLAEVSGTATSCEAGYRLVDVPYSCAGGFGPDSGW